MRLLTLLILVCCCTPAVGVDDHPQFVSMIQLIATPQQFHGKRIRVVGFAAFEFESNVLMLSADDEKYAISKNGLELAISRREAEERRVMFNRRYVLIEGTFDAQAAGRTGLMSGGIEKITRIEAWPPIVKKKG